MHQHLADNQHAEPIGLLRGAGDEVQLLCTRLKKSEFHIIQSDAQLFPAEQRIEADAERFAQAGKLRRCDWQIDVDTALPAMGVNWWQSSGRIKNRSFLERRFCAPLRMWLVCPQVMIKNS